MLILIGTDYSDQGEVKGVFKILYFEFIMLNKINCEPGSQHK